MTRRLPLKRKEPDFDAERLRKGTLLVVRVPPFYDREYLYEILGAGGKQIRAKLYHSPTVKKQWTIDDLAMLFSAGMIRYASDEDVARFEGAARLHFTVEREGEG